MPTGRSSRGPLDVKDLLVNRIAELFDDRERADVVLTAPSDGREFYVHRGIVAGWSPVLRRLFEEEFNALSSGAGQGLRDMTHIQRIELPFEGSSAAVDELLRFCYTGSVDLESAAQALELLAAATIYEVHPLAQVCKDQLSDALGPAEVARLLQREQERISGLSAASNGGKLALPEPGDLLEALYVQEIRKSQDPNSPVVGHLDPKEHFAVERAVEAADRRGEPQWRVKCARGWVDMFEDDSARGPSSRSHGTALEFHGQHFFKRFALAPYGRSGHAGGGGKSTVITKPQDTLHAVHFETVRVHMASELQKIVREMFYSTTAPVTEVFGLPCTAIRDHDHSVDHGTLSFRRGDTVVVTDRSAPDWWVGTVNGRATGRFPKHKVELDVRFAQKQSQSDVTVVLHDEDTGTTDPSKRVFLVHRAILSIWSKTFEEEFGHNMLDSRRKTDHTYTLNLPHYGHPNEMQDLLTFFYTGELAVTKRNAPAILHLGMIYGVNELLTRHCKRLLQQEGDSRTYDDLRKKTTQLRIKDNHRYLQTAKGGHLAEESATEHERREQRSVELPIVPGCSALVLAKERLRVSEGSIITRRLMEEVVHMLYPTLNLRREVDLVCAMLDPSAGLALHADKLDVALKYVLYFRYMRPIFDKIEEQTHDGRLALSDFERACNYAGEVMTTADMREAFNELDEEYNDVVEVHQFCEWACKRNVDPIGAADISARTKQRLLMPSAAIRSKALRQVGVPTDDAVLSITSATEALEQMFPGHSLSAECLSAFRAVQVKNSHVYELLCADQGHDIEYEQALVGAEGESPFHAPHEQEVLGADFRQLVQYAIWLHDHWPKLQIVITEIADQKDQTLTVAEFSCACMMMNIHLADEDELRRDFGMLERNAPNPPGFAVASDFVNWILLTHPFEEVTEVGGEGLTLQEASKRSPRPEKHAHVHMPRFGGEHDLQMPPDEDVTALFEKYDPNGHGLTKTDVGHALREIFPRISVLSHPALFRAFEAADESQDGWIGAEEFTLLIKYFIYFYREHSKLEAIRNGIEPDTNGVRFIHYRCPKSKSASKCSCKGAQKCQLFWLKAESMDIQLTGATAGSKYKQAAGFEVIDGQQHRANLTFANFCTWVVKTKCGPDFEKEVKRNRQDGHFVVDVDEAQKRTGKMKQPAKPFDVPVPDHCQHIWEEVGLPGGNLGIEDVTRAVHLAWPDFQDTGLMMARAMRATGMDQYGHIAESQFRELMRHLNFFVTKSHVLSEVDRSSKGRVSEPGFKRVCRNLGLKLTNAEMSVAFKQLATTHEEHASNVTMQATRHYEEGCHSLPYEDLLVWAAAEHMGKHVPRRQGSQCAVPPFRSKSRTSTCEVFKKLDTGAGFLTLAEITQGVEMIWPHLEVPRSMILLAYNACKVHGGGKIRHAEFHQCLQWISYLDFAWEVLNSLNLNEAGRMDVDQMIHACQSLEEWLESDEIFDIFHELTQGGNSISFDQFCNWLLGRHVEPPIVDEEVDELEAVPPQVPEDVPPAVDILLPDLEEREKWFDEWDDDRNGFLSLAEVEMKIFDRFPELLEQIVRRAYKAADYSGNGFIGRQEFNKFLRFLEFFNNFWAIFQGIEKDLQQPSRLTISEFKRAAARLGMFLDSGKASAVPSAGRSRDDMDAVAEFKGMRTFRNDRVLMVDFCTWAARKKCGADQTWHDTTKYAHMGPKEVYKLGTLYKRGDGVERNLEEAYLCFKSAANRGSVSGRRELAECYMQGKGVAKDVTHGIGHLMQAADMGDQAAQCRLGLAYMAGDGVPKDPKKAYKQFLAGAQRNNPKCQFNLGLCFANGDGVPRDDAMAFQYYMQAAQQELPEAQNNVGECFITGNGVGQDVKEGMKWKKKASDRGVAEAQFNLGVAYLHGYFGVEQNTPTAMAYLKLAEKQNHPEAQKIIDQIKQQQAQKERELKYNRRLRDYLEIEGDEIRLNATLAGELREDAIDHVEAAAAEGVTEARWHLGRLIEAGHLYTKHNGKPNLELAAEQYANAAQAKHVGSLYRLGEVLMHLGWEQGQLELHWTEAVRNFTKAANAGHVEAMYSLGEAWMASALSGDDDDPKHVVNSTDAEKALAWFVKAAENGDQRAQFNLGLLYQDGGLQQDGHGWQFRTWKHGRSTWQDFDEDDQHTLDDADRLGDTVVELRRGELIYELNLARLEQKSRGTNKTREIRRPAKAFAVARSFHRSVYYYRMAARHGHAVQAKMNLAWLLLKHHQPAAADEWDTVAEAQGLMREAHTDGHHQASVVLEHWDDIVELIRGPGSIIDRMEVFAHDASEVLHHMMQNLLAKEIEHQQQLDDLLKLKQDLHKRRFDREKEEETVATLKEEKEFKEARNGRLLMISSCTWHPRRLVEAGSKRSTCVDLQWAATEAVPQEHSLDHVLEQAHRAMSRENATGRYKSAALWTVAEMDSQGTVTGFKLTEGNEVTLRNVQRDEECRNFWRGMADMIDEDGYFVLFGLGDGGDTEDWHDMLKELSILMNRGVINVDICPEYDVLDDGTLSREMISNQDFRDFFDIDLAQEWAQAVAPDLEEERRKMEPYEEEQASAQRQKQRAEDRAAADEARYRDDLEREGRADYRVSAEVDRIKRQRDREAHISPHARRSTRLVPREVKAVHEVQAFLHDSDIDQVQLMFGIDFAGSNEWNGSKTFGGRSLHALDAGVPTPYEAVIQSVCQTMDVFDDADKTIPCYGFGDHRVTGSKDSDERAASQSAVFSLIPGDQPCNGVEEIISRYRAVKQAVMLGKPKVDKRCFAPIINKAIELLNEKRDTASLFDQFHVLVILTDGEVHRDSRVPSDEWSPEEMETVEAIQKASHLPLSIVVIGVGDGTGERVSDDDGQLIEGGCWKSLHQMEHSIDHREFENFVFTEYGRHSHANMSHQVKLAQLAANAVRQLPAQWRVIRKKAISDPLGPHEKVFERKLPESYADDSDEDDADHDAKKEEWDVDESKEDKSYVSYVKTRPPPIVPQEQAGKKSPRSASPRSSSPRSLMRIAASNDAKFIAQIRGEFDRLGVGRDQVLVRKELKAVVDGMHAFDSERFSDWHFEQFCDLSGIDPDAGALQYEDLENYCRYMNSRPWAEKAFCVYDRASPRGVLTEAELCLLCRNELKAFHKALGRRLPSAQWDANAWARFWHEYGAFFTVHARRHCLLFVSVPLYLCLPNLRQ